MKLLFESKFEKGFMNLYEADGHLVTRLALRKEALGVALEIPDPEAADLAEALLRHLGPVTAASVYSSTLRKSPETINEVKNNDHEEEKREDS